MAAGSAHTTTGGGDLALIEGAAVEAGRIAMRFFRGDNTVWTKAGNSPVSEADLEVDRFLHRALLDARPDYGWLSEESVDDGERLERSSLFIADPIDGTRGFVGGDARWCISVAVASGGAATTGVLHCPALGRTFTAVAGGGARLNGTPLAPLEPDRIRSISGSRKINEALEAAFPGRFAIPPAIPSLAYRIALVASGEIDGALARGGVHEWDIAAADVILREAGGRLTDANGRLPRYNRARLDMPCLIAAASDRHSELVDIAKSGNILH